MRTHPGAPQGWTPLRFCEKKRQYGSDPVTVGPPGGSELLLRAVLFFPGRSRRSLPQGYPQLQTGAGTPRLPAFLMSAVPRFLMSASKLTRRDGVATFRYTTYSFKPRGPVQLETYELFRSLSTAELEAMLRNTKRQRWMQFGRDFIIPLVIVGSAVLAVCVSPLLSDHSTRDLFVGLGFLIGSLGLLSVGISAITFAVATHKELGFYRRAFQTAVSSNGYESYAMAHQAQYSDKR